MKTFLRTLTAFSFFILFFCNGAKAQTSGYSGTGANIDVVYHRAEWRINPDAAKNITGTVTTYFVTTQASVKKISFDLSSVHTFSATYNGNDIVAGRPSSTSNIIELTLPVTLPVNKLDSVTISYSGTPPDFADYGEGFEEKSITGMGYVAYTLAESYGDDDWWPCKADMKDKIDSMDFIITTPSLFRAATNGVLISNVVSGSNRTMKYKHRYPIASYLVAVSVAQYNVFDRGTVNISGTSMPVEYYIYSGHGSNPTAQLDAMDFCKDELVAFSQKFGDYPFKKEKYGMYEFGWGGGMEHQTFSAMGWSTMSSWSVIAHELAHQWFGNKVTFATWNHLWLAEGFAKYSEALAAELVPGLGQSSVMHRADIKSLALSTSTTPIYLSNATIANSSLIWTTANDRAIYQRGAMVVSMLRKLAGDDKFFLACRNYLNDPALAYKSATTENLRDHFEAVLHYDLDAFFTDYIYGTGNPAYDVNWGNSGTGLNVELTTQRRSASSTVAYFRTPVVLKIYNLDKTKDTTVVIYDENGTLSYAGKGIQETHSGKVLGYKLSFVPASVTVDPNAETLVRGQDATTAKSTVTKVTRLNTAPLVVLDISIVFFSGMQKEEGNLLSLSIAPTTENVFITLEKSENGNRFYSIGAMKKTASTTDAIKFQLVDPEILANKIYYYRGKTIDEKGIAGYSKIVSIKGQNKTASIKLSPNPVSDYLLVSLPQDWQDGEVAYLVYNNVGAVVIKEILISAGSKIQFSVRQLRAGNYNIKLNIKGGKQLVKSFTVFR